MVTSFPTILDRRPPGKPTGGLKKGFARPNGFEDLDGRIEQNSNYRKELRRN